MEYRFLVSIPYLLTVREAFGWEGRRTLVHWHQGVSETYPSKPELQQVKSGIMGLARATDGTVWVGIGEEGRSRT